jgi:hypothetical protein
MLKPIFIITALTLGLLVSDRVVAQEKTAPSAAAKSTPASSPEELESAFKSMLAKATLTGRWCSLKEGKMGPEKEDKYTIVSAEKLGGDKWQIHTRIRMNQQEMVVPIPVQMKWAGDTAVMIVEKLQYPGGGTYSARLIFYNKTYSGTWSGGDHGGLMYGIISNEK